MLDPILASNDNSNYMKNKSVLAHKNISLIKKISMPNLRRNEKRPIIASEALNLVGYSMTTSKEAMSPSQHSSE